MRAAAWSDHLASCKLQPEIVNVTEIVTIDHLLVLCDAIAIVTIFHALKNSSTKGHCRSPTDLANRHLTTHISLSFGEAVAAVLELRNSTHNASPNRMILID